MNQVNQSSVDIKYSQNKNTSIAKGFLFLIIGLAVLLRQIPETKSLIPDYLFGIHTLLILLGIYKGIKHNFKNTSWLVLIIAGILIGINQFSFLNTNELLLYGLPIGLIVLGLFIIFKKS